MIESYVKTYRDILSQIDEASLARFYLHMDVGKKYKSLFRSDNTPSASLYYSSGGRLRYNDFKKNLSLPEIFQIIFNLSYSEVLKKISKDFNLINIQRDYKPKKIISSKFYNQLDNDNKSVIKIKSREFKQYDLNYWQQYGITKEWLQLANITPISKFWIINKKGNHMFDAAKLSYSYNYYYHNGILLRKIYQPQLIDFKWLSCIDYSIVQGWHMLPKQGSNLLIVTSSYKDVGTIFCNTGIHCIAPNNELGFLPDKIIYKLTDRFDKILVLFDQDSGGHIGAERYKQKYGWDSIFIPEHLKAKDPSDYRSANTQRDFIQLINYLVMNTK